MPKLGVLFKYHLYFLISEQHVLGLGTVIFFVGQKRQLMSVDFPSL